MPGPAARVGDMTAHGGVIAGPGCPTVLIGGMPAANVTTMHVCPMVTVLVPHVGGPILPPGVPTVLIGGMPAATVGDMATCVGPPDVIIPPGCPTVLIGTSGGGSGGGGGGSAAAANAGAHSALVGEPGPSTPNAGENSALVGEPGSAAANAGENSALEDEPGPEAEGPHWIDIQFVDSAGNPVTQVPYEFTGVEGQKEKGRLTGDAAIRRGGLPKAGDYSVKLFSVFNAEWSEERARVGDVVKLSAETEGYEDGTKAVFRIWERDIDGADDFITEIETTVDGNKVEAEWTYEYHEDTDEVSEEDELKGYSAPEYYFIVHIEESKARSGLLEFKDWIEIELRDEEDNPIPDEEYILYLPDGSTQKGKLDGNGYKKEENIPPGHVKVIFSNLSNITKSL